MHMGATVALPKGVHVQTYIPRLRRVRLWSLLTLIGAMTLALSIALNACGGASSVTQVVGAPPDVWDAPPVGQDFASGPAGAIALKWSDFTPQQFRIYFVFRPSKQVDAPSHPIALRITASSSLASHPATPPVPLAATIQTLGQIDEYTVGVMHIEHLNRADQLVTLAITPSLVGAATWRLSPIHQRIYEPHAQTATGVFGAYSDGLPEAQWHWPVVLQGELELSYVKVVLPGQPVANHSYVFVRSDSSANVQVMSKAQYIALAGADNFTP